MNMDTVWVCTGDCDHLVFSGELKKCILLDCVKLSYSRVPEAVHTVLEETYNRLVVQTKVGEQTKVVRFPFMGLKPESLTYSYKKRAY